MPTFARCRWFILAVLLTSACGSPKPSGLYSTATERFTFSDDGTAIFEGHKGAVPATWRMLDDDRFLITVTGFGSVSTFACKTRDGINIRLPPPGDRVVHFQQGEYGTSQVTSGSSLGLMFGERKDCKP
ncbi:hypothetical protein WG908_03290 [Sphingobium sp. AN641]|uniref:hypothetical protein n=1 Tax=Sphingobium sp. AN641 TaxID=3133443 RepID=UPI0030C4D2CA